MLTLRGRWKIKQLRTVIDESTDAPVVSNGQYNHDLVSSEVASDYAQTPAHLAFHWVMRIFLKAFFAFCRFGLPHCVPNIYGLFHV